MVPLFNPRTDNWHDHFRWDGYHIIGFTSVGRATIEALCLNHDRRIKIRQVEQLLDLSPPNSDELKTVVGRCLARTHYGEFRPAHF